MRCDHSGRGCWDRCSQGGPGCWESLFPRYVHRLGLSSVHAAWPFSYICHIMCGKNDVQHLTGEMAESRAKRVRIKEMDGWTLGLLVDYIYTAEIQVTEDNVQVKPTHIYNPRNTSSEELCINCTLSNYFTFQYKQSNFCFHLNIQNQNLTLCVHTQSVWPWLS